MDLFDDGLEGLDLSLLNKNGTQTPPKKDGTSAPANDKTEGGEEGDDNDNDEFSFGNRIPVKEVEEEETDDEPEGGEGDEPDPAKNKKTAAPKAEELEEEEEEEEDNKGGDGEPLKVFASLVAQKLGLDDFKAEEFNAEDDDALIGLAEKKAEKLFEDYKNSLPDDLKYIIDNYQEGVPPHVLLAAQAERYNYEAIEDSEVEEDDRLQEILISDLNKKLGFSDDEIKEALEEAKDAGTTKTQAKRALKKLKEFAVKEEEQRVNAEKQRVATAAKEREEKIQKLNETIKSKKEILPGFEMTDEQKKILFEGITKFDRNGKNAILRKRAEDPDFDLKVAYMATVLNWDFSAFERKAETKSTKKIADIVKSQDKKGSVSKGKTSQTDLNIMKRALGIK